MRFLLAILSCIFMLNCAGTPHNTAEDECQHFDETDRQLNCYEIGIRTAIHDQFQSDIQDYAQLATTYDVIQGVKVSVTLTIEGEIEGIQLLTTSGDAFLDKFFMQTIKNASPFPMPREEALREQLLRFTYSLNL